MHKFDLKNKVAIITGGAQGFGFDIAKRFINCGAKVFIWDVDEKELLNAKKELDNPNLLTNLVDVSNFKNVKETVNKIIQINLMGTFNCCKYIVPSMIKNNYGRIVNVASVAGKDGNANASAYSVGKAGAIGLTKSLGKELADKNIAVNAITPAGANTRILDQMTKEHVQRMLSKVPRGRFLEVEEFTSLVCWLSSEENTFSTAAVFDISGGRSTY